MLQELTGVPSAFSRRDGDFERALRWSVSVRAPDLTAAMLLHAGLRAAGAHAIDDAAERLLADTEPANADRSAAGSAAVPSDARLRGAVLLALATTHFWHGAHDDVDARLLEALACAQRAGDVPLQADALGMAACADSYRVRPRQAGDAGLRAHCLLRGHPGLRVPSALRLASAIGSVMRADLAGAERTLRAAGPADPGPGGPALVLWRSTVLALSGRPGEARALLDTAGDGPWPGLLLVQRDVLRAEIATGLGRPRAALELLGRHRGGTLSALADVSRGRARLALNDLPGARQCVHGLLSGTRPRLSRYVLVEAMLLEASIAARDRDPSRALEVITNALDVAGDDLVLPFARARQPLGALLSRHPAVAVRWPAVPSGIASSALAGPGPGRREITPRRPPVRLTQREQSILTYLTTSMTAGEIAAELYLSVNTVKTHLAAIYRKLGAGGRRAAVRRARELELL